jgi:hypothetical protein
MICREEGVVPVPITLLFFLFNNDLEIFQRVFWVVLLLCCASSMRVAKQGSLDQPGLHLAL